MGLTFTFEGYSDGAFGEDEVLRLLDELMPLTFGDSLKALKAAHQQIADDPEDAGDPVPARLPDWLAGWLADRLAGIQRPARLAPGVGDVVLRRYLQAMAEVIRDLEVRLGAMIAQRDRLKAGVPTEVDVLTEVPSPPTQGD